MEKAGRRLVGAALGIMISTTLAASPRRTLTYIGSLQGTTGNYLFAERTNSLHFYNGLAFSAAILDFSVSVPLIYQSTPWIASAGPGVFPSGGHMNDWSGDTGGMGGGMGGGMHNNSSSPAAASGFHRLGVGDLLIHGKAQVSPERSGTPSISVSGDLKIPLASSSMGFGTGKLDYGAGLALSKRFGEVFTFVNTTYWALGNLPGLDFNNPVAYSVAVGHPFAGGNYSLLASYSGSTTIIPGQTPPSQIGLGFSRSLNYGSSLSATAAFGLTDTTPQFSLGVGWRIAL